MCALLENTVEAGLFLMIILHVLSISWVPFHAQSGSLYVSKNTGMLSVQKAGLDMLTPLWKRELLASPRRTVLVQAFRQLIVLADSAQILLHHRWADAL